MIRYNESEKTRRNALLNKRIRLNNLKEDEENEEDISVEADAIEDTTDDEVEEDLGSSIVDLVIAYKPDFTEEQVTRLKDILLDEESSSEEESDELDESEDPNLDEDSEEDLEECDKGNFSESRSKILARKRRVAEARRRIALRKKQVEARKARVARAMSESQRARALANKESVKSMRESREAIISRRRKIAEARRRGMAKRLRKN